MSGGRVTVITAGHPSTCPRMVKAADALAGAGYDVRLVCTRFIDWAIETDAHLIARRTWKPVVVDYHPRTAPRLSTYVRGRRKAAASVVTGLGAERSPWWAVTRAYSYVHPELVNAALAEPADFFYGGTTGALAAVSEAATRAGRPYGLDFEDWHTAESSAADAAVQHALAARIESAVIPAATVLTTSSTAIAAAYQGRYGRKVETIHNVFPLPSSPPPFTVNRGSLRCYWFSQTIGTGRGLEAFVDAAGLADVPIVLELRGREDAGYLAQLRSRASARAPRLRIDVQPPAPPDDMVSCAAGHDIGLSLEMPVVENRRISIPNKMFVYLNAGLAVIATSTVGQRELADSLGHAAAWTAPDKPEEMAAHLRRWSADRDALSSARREAWDAAVRRWHWGHPSESGRLVGLVAAALA